MLDRILALIKKIIPKSVLNFLLPFYHHFLALFSAWFYYYPADKMIIVGVTGTAGKSSTCYYIAQILEQAGWAVGMTTTTLFKIKNKEWLNDKKMTMIGRLQLQKTLAKMAKAGCQCAIIETSSEGIKQFRHTGINYDILVFTNLYPEHLEAHGGFENYKQTKGKLFASLADAKKKIGFKVKKTIIVNLDDQFADYFLSFDSEEKIGYSHAEFTRTNLKTNLLGDYNQSNVAAALAVVKALDLPQPADVSFLKPLPGRLEFIENKLGLKIIVDYAFEPQAMEKLYTVVKDIPHQKIIQVLGSAGGGRDKARRARLGSLAAEQADIVIVTNEDPYDEDPCAIIKEVLQGAADYWLKEFGTPEDVENFKFSISNFKTILNFSILNNHKTLYAVLDRRAAITLALKLALPNDLVLITGKGAEQAICVADSKKIPWDDRQVVREELARI
ncbi:MAG TPA: Mur ligase family protein [bacterium]|nr:Mur ligase family protein [bacterium]